MPPPRRAGGGRAQGGRAQAGGGGEERAGVRMLRRGQDLARVPLLDDAPVLHHDDAVGAVGGDPQIVSDQEHGGAEVAGEEVEVVEDLLLHRHVEGARRLVRDDELGVGGEGGRDEGALFHPSGELMGELPCPRLGFGDPGEAQQLHGARIGAARVRQSVDDQGLAHLAPDALDGIEARRGVLRDERDPTAAHVAPGPRRQRRDVVAGQSEGPGIHRGVGGEQTDDRVGRRALARSRLADDRDDLAATDGEPDTVDGGARAPVDRVGHGQVLDLEHGAHRRPPSRSRARATRLADRTTATMTSPGSVVSHHATAR